jgi:NADPH:quinone reductase-like Zn-dependent oxidoreductase
MYVAEVAEYGGPEAVRVVERPDPVPAVGRVLVRVAASAVNPVDLWAREGRLAAALPGLTPPFVPGWDLSGTVLEDAAGFTAGQRVVGLIPWFDVAAGGVGAHAELLSAEPGWLAPLPDGVDLVGAATLGLNAPTAAQALDLVDLPAGATLLVTGASGAVGGFAVQLASARGATVVGLAGGADDEAYLAAIGAELVLPRTAPADLAGVVRAAYPDGVDVVLDAALIGGPAIGAVRDGGTFVSASAPAAPPAERGVTVTSFGVRPDSPQLARLAQDLATGRLLTRVAATVPLADAVDAHRRAGAHGLRGKVILTTS